MQACPLRRRNGILGANEKSAVGGREGKHQKAGRLAGFWKVLPDCSVGLNSRVTNIIIIIVSLSRIAATASEFGNLACCSESSCVY